MFRLLKSPLLAVLISAYGITTAYAGSPQVIARLIMGDSLDSFGGQIESAGDQNGDGFNDLWVSQSYYGREHAKRVYLFHGGSSMDTIPDFVFDVGAGQMRNVGDMNGDGFEDVVLLHYDSEKVFTLHFGGPLLSSVPAMVFRAVDQDFRTLGCPGTVCGGSDLDGDGQADLAIGEPSSSQNANATHFYFSDPAFDVIPDYVLREDSVEHYVDYGLNNVFFADIGNHPSLGISRRSSESFPQSGSVLVFSVGAALDTIPEFELRSPAPYTLSLFGTLLENVGDVNGDGFDDVVVGTSNSTDAWVYFGGPDFDTIPDVTIVPSLRTLKGIGDVNNDSYDDLIAGESPFSGRAWIYYGGPDIDGLVDQKVASHWECSGFGRSLAGLGDVNGDGIDDFAVGAVLSIDRPRYPGLVYIFAGYDSIPTDVEIRREDVTVADFRLSHNYPNPFNPLTTIEFDVPRRYHVNLSIYNVLGELVTQLVDDELSSGSYRVDWDGRDAGGVAVASGVYFYRLSAGDYTQSRKMVLLK